MLEELIKSFITLFVIMDPLAILPIFLSYTRGLPVKEIEKSAHRAISVACFIVFIFLFLGLEIFGFFGISIGEFEIAGGFILLVIAVLYVLGIRLKGEHLKNIDASSVPIGTPLLAGPGTITTTIILVGNYGMLVTIVAVILVLLASLIIFVNAAKINKLIGEQWLNVMSRVMGILIAAIAVGFIKNGIMSIMALV